MDPNSYKGKLSLLVIDKLVITAILAVALALWNIKSEEIKREESARMTAIELALVRGGFAKEVVPMLVSEDLADLPRLLLIESARSSGVFSSQTALELLLSYDFADVSTKTFTRIVSPIVVASPESLSIIGRLRGKGWSEDYPEKLATLYDQSKMSLEAFGGNNEKWKRVTSSAEKWFSVAKTSYIAITKTDSTFLDTPDATLEHFQGLYLGLGSDEWEMPYGRKPVTLPEKILTALYNDLHYRHGVDTVPEIWPWIEDVRWGSTESDLALEIIELMEMFEPKFLTEFTGSLTNGYLKLNREDDRDGYEDEVIQSIAKLLNLYFERVRSEAGYSYALQLDIRRNLQPAIKRSKRLVRDMKIPPPPSFGQVDQKVHLYFRIHFYADPDGFNALAETCSPRDEKSLKEIVKGPIFQVEN